MQEIYKRFRPKTLKGVVGQDGAIASLQKLLDKGALPHALLLTGPSGVGKTTIARILKDHLSCGDNDFFEINCADFKGVDDVRSIRRMVGFAPLGGCRVWLIDEAHKLTNDAQNALLKLLEDTPKHAYFMLATTDPQKLIKTIHTRCFQIKLEGMNADSLKRVIRRVTEKEGMKVSDDVVDEIIEASDSSARKALVILEQVGLLEGDVEQIKAIQNTTFNKDLALDLARILVTKSQTPWAGVATILKGLKDQDAEGIRYCVLGYARAVLLSGGPLARRSFIVIDVFSDNFYDSKQAGLAAACWEVVNAK